MQARAPAKAILSGEHSVVYGMPALALALPIYATVSINPATDSNQIELLLSDLDQRAAIDPSQLPSFKQRCDQRYQRFLDGSLDVEAVLATASDLYFYALSLWPDAAAALSGSRIELSSSIAIGSGMGSSAATVTALLTAMAGQLGQPLDRDRLIELTTLCERLQHGRSSGLDPAVCARGGLIQFQRGKAELLPVRLDAGWLRVDSGRPGVSTGSCTSQVKMRFGSSSIWSEFGDVTRQLASALQGQNADRILRTMRDNHRLLCRIGVVPEAVQRFVERVERCGGAAKISGAGAISGDQAGMILVYAPEGLSPKLASPEYQWQQLEMDANGAQFRD